MDPNLTTQERLALLKAEKELQDSRNVQAVADSNAVVAIANASATTLGPMARKYGLSDGVPPVVSTSSSGSSAPSSLGNNSSGNGTNNGTGNAGTGNAGTGHSVVSIENLTLPHGFPPEWVINDQGQYRGLFGSVFSSVSPIAGSQPVKTALLLTTFFVWAVGDDNKKTYLVALYDEFANMLKVFLAHAKGYPQGLGKQQTVDWIATVFVPEYRRFLTQPNRKVLVMHQGSLVEGITKSFNAIKGELAMEGSAGAKFRLRKIVLHPSCATTAPDFPLKLP